MNFCTTKIIEYYTKLTKILKLKIINKNSEHKTYAQNFFFTLY